MGLGEITINLNYFPLFYKNDAKSEFFSSVHNKTCKSQDHIIFTEQLYLFWDTKLEYTYAKLWPGPVIGSVWEDPYTHVESS